MWKVIEEVQISTAIRGHQDRWEMPFHRHASCEISAVLDGSGVFQVGDEHVRLEAGHIILIPPNIEHRYYADQSIRFGVLHAGNLNKDTKELFQTIAPANRPRVLKLSSIDLDMYESLFRHWLRTVSEPLRERELVLNTWIRLFLVTLLQHADARGLPLSVASAAEYIRTNLKQAPPVQELARLSGVSESSFRRLFHETYGMSPKQYMQQTRLTEAKWLLRSTTKSVQTVAEQIGFLSIHAFSAWFQKIEGASPNEWRKLQQGMHDGSSPSRAQSL